MKFKKKHLVISLVLSLVLIILFLRGYQVCLQGKEEGSPLEVYSDKNLKYQVTSLEDPGVFDHFQEGWNTQSFYIKNTGEQSIQVGMIATLLPKGWRIGWNYTGDIIEAGSTVEVVISIFCLYSLPVDHLMLGITFRYRVVD